MRRAVPSNIDDGEAAVLEPRRFVRDLRMTGRTTVDIDDDVEVSIVDPEQYRRAVLALMVEDIKDVTAALGDDYRVVVNGADRPIQWVRAGSLGVTIFFPYSYTIVPASFDSITQIYPEY